MLNDKEILKIRKSFNGTNQREIFKILGDTNRYRIFRILSNLHQQLTVSEIAKVLKISLSLASQHLKILEQGKLLKKEKHGQQVLYKIRLENKLAQSISHDVM